MPQYPYSGGLFQASGGPGFDSAQRLKLKFKKTVCITNVAADYSGGWTAGQDHLASGTVVSAVAVSGEFKDDGSPKNSIIVTDVLACQDAAYSATIPLSFTLAEQGLTTDILRMTVNGGAPCVWSTEGVKVEAGKHLILCMGRAAGVASITISYVRQEAT